MMDAPMEDTDAARDEQELAITEQKLLEAYRDRGGSVYGACLHPFHVRALSHRTSLCSAI